MPGQHRAKRERDAARWQGASAPVFVRPPSSLGELGTLLAAMERLQSAADVSTLVRRAIEVARSHIGLDRVGVFLLDAKHESMLGTWGTDRAGQIVDQRRVKFALDADVVDVFLRAESGNQPFTVLERCPAGAPLAKALTAVGHAWVASTPIRSPRGRIGVMYNDPGSSGAPVDDARQARAAILCNALGAAIEIARTAPRIAAVPKPRRAKTAKRSALQRAVHLLARDPRLGGRDLAASAGISQRQLARLFKSALGVSLPTYRNWLRIEQVQKLLDGGKSNLSEVARSAGFGSYAQFHRVFHAAYGVAPRDYRLRE